MILYITRRDNDITITAIKIPVCGSEIKTGQIGFLTGGIYFGMVKVLEGRGIDFIFLGLIAFFFLTFFAIIPR